MTKDEALKLALEALEDLGMKHYENTGEVLYKETFTAIKAALEAKDEPVAWAMLHDNGHFIDAIHPNEHARVEGEYITPLYTTPPQRTWVCLTDEEIEDAWASCEVDWDDKVNVITLAKAIEAKLKEKNGNA
jgi:hypothetical protein